MAAAAVSRWPSVPTGATSGVGVGMWPGWRVGRTGAVATDLTGGTGTIVRNGTLPRTGRGGGG